MGEVVKLKGDEQINPVEYALCELERVTDEISKLPAEALATIRREEYVPGVGRRIMGAGSRLHRVRALLAIKEAELRGDRV